MNFHGKKILLGVCGGIAAYKAVDLLRKLRKSGAEVKVILTPGSADFVGKITFSALNNGQVYDQLIENGHWVNHVHLAQWADIFVIAPTTSHSLYKLAQGKSNDLLSCVYMSFEKQVFIAPALDLEMARHPSYLDNVQKLSAIGNILIGPEEGELASGLFGKGRMSEPSAIMDVLFHHFKTSESLKGKTIMVTAGPTHEPIDAVRFIGNHSSGKMGFAIAHEALKRGARVKLISGPSDLNLEHPHLELHRVMTAQEMFDKAKNIFPNVDVVIKAAAVADYRPEITTKGKIKKSDHNLTINLVPNPDILAYLGKIKTKQFLIGFALETDNETQHAQEKLKRKNLDLIVLNSLKDSGAGFNSDENKIKIIGHNNFIKEFRLKSKTQVAIDIMDTLISLNQQESDV